MVVGISREKREQREKVNLVNLIIEDCFGKGFSGDWHTSKGAHKGFFNDGFERNCKLNMIRKNNFKQCNFIYAAIFNEEDGSAMTVHPEHYVSALKYAGLYREATGKDVKIRALKERNLFFLDSDTPPYTEK